MGCWNRQPDKYFEAKIYEGLDASDVFAGWKIVGVVGSQVNQPFRNSGVGIDYIQLYITYPFKITFQNHLFHVVFQKKPPKNHKETTVRSTAGYPKVGLPSYQDLRRVQDVTFSVNGVPGKPNHGAGWVRSDGRGAISKLIFYVYIRYM